MSQSVPLSVWPIYLLRLIPVPVEVSITALTFVISCCVTTVKMSGNCLVLVCKRVSSCLFANSLVCFPFWFNEYALGAILDFRCCGSETLYWF